ncbi:MAG: DUF1844 domain-containing protein [Armatimonadota bacterium]|nr:DUF1844 domain-containing protein [Armatimonadota bacterium]MDR7401154.1 DUF1844 domain-containing protein [Armatimonadota bacterium]MDR7403426.1 DUF1844 domain-containing protein [Armatimonadota bacterium]MDR7438050.1 DUF1844 domain-containing protein [Armatimonadota bacterium]MDR7471809.1 DUF1844 domain-containing protein [Armatimonadota bacterium]
MAEEQETAQTPEQPATLVDLLRWFVGVLAGSAWQYLGLVPNPNTKKIEQNFDDARLAIDTMSAVLDLLRPRLDDRQRREMDALLADLRLNFVEQKARAEAAQTAGRPAGGP